MSSKGKKHDDAASLDAQVIANGVKAGMSAAFASMGEEHAHRRDPPAGARISRAVMKDPLCIDHVLEAGARFITDNGGKETKAKGWMRLLDYDLRRTENVKTVEEAIEKDEETASSELFAAILEATRGTLILFVIRDRPEGESIGQYYQRLKQRYDLVADKVSNDATSYGLLLKALGKLDGDLARAIVSTERTFTALLRVLKVCADAELLPGFDRASAATAAVAAPVPAAAALGGGGGGGYPGRANPTERKCQNCWEFGHNKYQCNNPTYCFNCKQKAGHVSADCPKPLNRGQGAARGGGGIPWV